MLRFGFGWAQILKLGWVTRSCGKINQTMLWVKTLSLISIYLVYPLLSKVEFVSENSYMIYRIRIFENTYNNYDQLILQFIWDS